MSMNSTRVDLGDEDYSINEPSNNGLWVAGALVLCVLLVLGVWVWKGK